jgi:hypothetical protein
MWCISRKNCHGQKVRSLLPKTALKLFFRKTHFRSVFTKLPPSPISGPKWIMWHVLRKNCHRQKVRSLLPKTALKLFFRKARFRSIFTEPPPSPIFEAKWTMWHVSRQNCHAQKFRSLLPKTALKSFFFRKTRFRSIFTKLPPSPIFVAKRTMWLALRQKYHRRKLCLLFPKTAPKSFFRKSPFQSVFTKPSLHLFSGPNELCGAFRGKIVTDEKVAWLSLQQPRNRFYETIPLT